MSKVEELYDSKSKLSRRIDSLEVKDDYSSYRPVKNKQKEMVNIIESTSQDSGSGRIAARPLLTALVLCVIIIGILGIAVVVAKLLGII